MYKYTTNIKVSSTTYKSREILYIYIREKKTNHYLTSGLAFILVYLVHVKKYSYFILGHLRASRTIKVVFENDYVYIIDKCINVPLYNTYDSSSSTVLEMLSLRVFNKQLNTRKYRNGIIHRIDKISTGLVILVKNVTYFRVIQKMFEYRHVFKYYRILILGGLRKQQSNILTYHLKNTVIKTSLKSHYKDQIKMSQSRYFKIGTRNLITHLLVNITTGRKHQIRLQMFYFRKSIIGDKRYSLSSKFCNKLYHRNKSIFNTVGILKNTLLHSEILILRDNKLFKKLSFTTNVPRYFKYIVYSFG